MPEELDQEFDEWVRTIEKEKQMQYVSGLERRAEKRGMQRGMQQGEVTLLRRQLERKFGPLPGWAEERLEEPSSAALELWADRVLDAKALDEVFGAK